MKIISLIALILAVSFSYNCQQKNPENTTVTSTTSSSDLKSIYFDYDDSLVRSDQASVLKSNFSMVKDKSATVEGHCDERGSNEYNLALGQRRAQAVKSYYVNLGAEGSKIKVISYGESKPACSSSDESCWSKNRRADTRK